MNFEKLSRIIEESKKLSEANNPGMSLPLTTSPSPVVSKNAMAQNTKNDPLPNASPDKIETIAILKKIENKLGQHGNTYKPLITYLSRNKEALAMFNDLLQKVGEMNASTASNILSAR